MTLWLVRAGRYGEREDFDLQNKVIAIGWDKLNDLSTINSKEELAATLDETYTDEGDKTLMNWSRQLWYFTKEITVGDLFAMPSKRQAVIFVGKVVGEYRYEEDNPSNSRHIRSVKWLGELPRNKFRKDLLYSLSAPPTINPVRVNNAEVRVLGMLKGEEDVLVPTTYRPNENVSEIPPDIEEFTRDQIRKYINSRFKGHGLARLAGGVLQAQGYKVHVSPEGPDGGVDIIAGKGALGFESPRLVVQVKSAESPIDVGVLRELKGVMSTFNADQGLIVAWGGYRSSVNHEMAREYFKIRLWDSDELVKHLQDNYDQLSDD